MHVTIGHLLHPALTGPGHRVTRMRARAPRVLRPVKPSHASELWYRGELKGIVRELRAAIEAQFLPIVKHAFPGILGDAAGKSAKQVLAGIKVQKFGRMDLQAERLARAAAYKNLGVVDERLAKSVRDSVSVNLEPYLTANPRIIEAVKLKTEENVSLIKTIPEQYFSDVQAAVESNWSEGARWESLTHDIANAGDVSESRAKVIARDQTSKMNAAFNQVRQTDIGIAQYEWSTMADEVVRPDHQDLAETVHRWDEPGPLAGTIDGEPCHPGEDILCRCVALPYFDLDAIEKYIGLQDNEE